MPFTRTWSDAEEDILLSPVPAREAQRRLVAAGYKPRSLRAVGAQRERIDPDPERRRLAQTLMALRGAALAGRSFKRQRQSRALREALRLGLARQRTKTTYRITLLGLVWLREEGYLDESVHV